MQQKLLHKLYAELDQEREASETAASANEALSCSQESIRGLSTMRAILKHVPGFIEKAEEFKSKGIDYLICTSMNDPFVMKAWAKTFPENKHVKFLVDGSASYTRARALGLELDLGDKGLGTRSRRFAPFGMKKERRRAR